MREKTYQELIEEDRRLSTELRAIISQIDKHLMNNELVNNLQAQLTTANETVATYIIQNKRLSATFAAQVDEIERLEGEATSLVEAIEYASKGLEDPGEDYRTGLHCGIEDRNIVDRYDAADYGWESAIEHVAQFVPSDDEIAALKESDRG
jgi:hypothetical protein